MMPVVTVAALVFSGGDILLVKSEKWSGKWGIPAGKVEYGEKTEDALKREMREETGLEVGEIQFLKVQELINEKDFWKETHFVSVNYVCRAKSEGVILNHEAEEYAWVGLEGALGMELNRPTRELIEYYLNSEKLFKA